MLRPFADRFRSIVEPLFRRQFTAVDGIPYAELDAIQQRTGYELPEAIRDFYAVLGRFEPALRSHNRFYNPGDFTRQDGKLVFFEENQVVVYWGYDEDRAFQPDPPVYQGVNDEPVEWYLESDHCSDFLAGMIYWQALNGALPFTGMASAKESVRQAAQSWPLVWQDADSQLFSQGSSAFAVTRGNDGVELQAAGWSEEDLEDIAQLLSVRWNYA
jgi:hypothetical protein